MLLETAEASKSVVVPVADVALSHPWAFVFMVILMFVFGVGRVAKETKTSVRSKSFLNFWMLTYLVLLAALMSLTTAMALVLLVDEKGQPRVTFIPPSFISMAASVIGVFGFEFLIRKLVIGFGATQLDLSTSLQNLVDQAVGAVLKKEASG